MLHRCPALLLPPYLPPSLPLPMPHQDGVQQCDGVRALVLGVACEPVNHLVHQWAEQVLCHLTQTNINKHKQKHHSNKPMKNGKTV